METTINEEKFTVKQEEIPWNKEFPGMNNFHYIFFSFFCSKHKHITVISPNLNLLLNNYVQKLIY